MHVSFILFQEFFNLLKSYHNNILHIKYLHMTFYFMFSINKFSFTINDIIDDLSGLDNLIITLKKINRAFK